MTHISGRLRGLEQPTRPWLAAIGAALLVALFLAGSALLMVSRSFRPIGEGELLAGEARTAAHRIATTGDPIDQVIRHIRTELEVEAVATVDGDGTVVAATSETLVGSPVHPLLAAMATNGSFAAVAVPLAQPVEIDGVVEWRPGDVLYQVIQPTGEESILLAFDLSEMLQRRAEATRISPLMVPAAIGAGIALLIAGLLAAAATRSRQIRREAALEAAYLQRRTTELEALNVELEQARADTQAALELAEEKNRIRAEFVLMINHELRTPLTGVVTGARVLATDDRLGPVERALIDDVVLGAERLESLIGQMLAVARVENRGLTAVPVDHRLETIAEVLGSAHERAQVIADPIAKRVVDTVRADTTTLTHLVASLVDNAYSHGANHVEVALTSELPGEAHHELGTRPEFGAYVVVVDDGPGIDPDFLPRAFEKFEKRSFNSGTGVGLYMVRLMAESMDASLSVFTSDRGTAIAVGLPAMRPATELVAHQVSAA